MADRPRIIRVGELPADIAEFTGREKQVKHLSDLLAPVPDGDAAAVRIALVAGYGGLGKTSLAVHAAHRVRGAFPDGQLYVDLLGSTPHPLSPADVLGRFLRDLGIDSREIPLDEAECAVRYRTSLAGRHTLIVLDDAHDAAQIRPLLPGSATCAVLMTARGAMPDLAGTKRLDLGVLDDGEALALFARMVGEERTAAEPEATAEVLRACAGLPLAVRICAARLATRSGWSIRSMADRLSDERRRLDELTVGDLAVRASFEVSFASLLSTNRGVDPADAFRLLGLWPGPTISSAAAAALFDTTENQATDALELLVDTYLLESVAPDRYKFHDLLRVYASERASAELSQHDREAATTRLLGWYMRTADAAATAVSPHRYTIPIDGADVIPAPPGFPGSDDALAWYDSERANVVAATRLAATSGSYEIAWRLPSCLFSVFHRRGHWADLVTTHRIALVSARQSGSRQAEAWVLNNLGNALARIGSADGISNLEEALAVSREIGDEVSEARAAHNLAEAHYLLNGPAAALDHMLRSLDIQRAVGYSSLHAATLNNLAEAYIDLRRLDDAIGCLEEAMKISMGINSVDIQGHVLLNLGRAYQELGRYDDSLNYLLQALSSKRASGDRPVEALILRLLGQIQLDGGDVAAARQSWVQSAMLYDEMGDSVEAAQVRAEAAGIIRGDPNGTRLSVLGRMSIGDQPSAFGELLRSARRRAGLTQEQLAGLSAVSVRTIRGLEQGTVSTPRSGTLQLLTDAMQLSDAARAELESVARGAVGNHSMENRAPQNVTGMRGNGPAQLPTDIADFTGREEQLEQLSEFLASAPHDDSGAVRVALVAGHGGLGKTSLAIHVAHRVRSAFPDGQLYVDLLGTAPHPLPAADVLARFLRDLSVDGQEIPRLDEAECAARYRTRLAGRYVLVVLDNARDAAQVRPLLPGSASCAVLVTARSRMPLLVSTKLVDLDVLDDDEALALFTKVIGEERAAAEPEATAKLLKACAGLPLAIRICAARLVTRSGWTIRAMADRLRDEHRRLDEMTVGDLAVRASFEVSFASLPAAKRGVDAAQAFRLLGLWRGPTISSAAAAALFGVTEDEAADALEFLVDAHLLESKAPDRYKFHDLLQVYASERAMADLHENDRQVATARLLSWYMRTASAAAEAITPHAYNIPLGPLTADEAAPLSFTGFDDALIWYDGERTNIVAATRQAAARGLHDIAWHLPASLFLTFLRRGNWMDCIAAHRIALESVRQSTHRQGEAWILNNLGRALGLTGNPGSVDCLERSLQIRREIGDRRGEAQTANNLSDLYTMLGQPEEALKMLYHALDLNREIGHPYGEAIALVNIGDALLNLGHVEEAIDWLQQARATFTEVKDADGLGYAMFNLGRCHFSLGHDGEAVASFQQALAWHQAAGNLHQQALTLRLLGRAQARLGDSAQARESWTQSAMIYDELGDSTQAARVRAEAAEIPGRKAGSR